MFVAVLAVSVLALLPGPSLAIGGEQVPDTIEIRINPEQDQLLQVLDAPADAIGTARDSRSPASSQTFKGKPARCQLLGKNVFGQCLQLQECYPYFRYPNAEPWVYGIYDNCNDKREGAQKYGVCCVKGDLNEPLSNVLQKISLDDDSPGLLDRSHVQFRPSRPTSNITITRSPTHRGDAWSSYPLFPAHPTHPPLPTHPPSITAQPWWNPTPKPITPPPHSPGVWIPPTSTPQPAGIWTQPTPTKTTTKFVATSPPSISSEKVLFRFSDKSDNIVQTKANFGSPCTPGTFYRVNETAKQALWDLSYGSSSKVVGGFPSRPHSHPWLATLFNGHKQFCGGSLIDKTHILTAAHCIAHMSSVDVSNLKVRLGAHNIKASETTTQNFKITKVVRHKDYDARKLYNDVAMLTLDRPAEFNDYVRPICLASGGSWVDDITTVAGWGSLYEGGPQPASLQEVRLRVWSLERCRSYYGSAAPGGIVSSYICAGDGGKDSCMGDSGGPLVKKINNVWTQIGVVSWGIGCGKGHYPGVYSRVPSFLPWINRVKAIYR